MPMREMTKPDQPLHLGLTEAGMGMKGLVWSSAAMGVLLADGIGDTQAVGAALPAPDNSIPMPPPIAVQELTHMAADLPSGKAGGPDGITYRHVKDWPKGDKPKDAR